jgi:hypothetical protein
MKPFFVFFLLFLFNTVFSQDYIDLIAKETCECVTNKKLNLKKVEASELQAQLGACMVPSYVKYRDKMPKEDIAEFTDNNAMRKLGEKIGVKMINHCPDLMIKLGQGYLENKKNKVEIEEDLVEVVSTDKGNNIVVSGDVELEGTFLEYKISDFITISLKDNTGRTHHLLLLNHFENADLISNSKLQTNQKISVSYSEHEFFDPKLKDYKYFKVLYSLKTL